MGAQGRLTVYNTWVGGLPCDQDSDYRATCPSKNGGWGRQTGNRDRWIKQRIEVGKIVEEQRIRA